MIEVEQKHNSWKKAEVNLLKDYLDCRIGFLLTGILPQMGELYTSFQQYSQ